MKKYIKSEHYAGSEPSYVIYYGEININTGELDNPQPLMWLRRYNDEKIH